MAVKTTMVSKICMMSQDLAYTHYHGHKLIPTGDLFLNAAGDAESEECRRVKRMQSVRKKIKRYTRPADQ
jgi:hypothetical protein